MIEWVLPSIREGLKTRVSVPVGNVWGLRLMLDILGIQVQVDVQVYECEWLDYRWALNLVLIEEDCVNPISA